MLAIAAGAITVVAAVLLALFGGSEPAPVETDKSGGILGPPEPSTGDPSAPATLPVEPAVTAEPSGPCTWIDEGSTARGSGGDVLTCRKTDSGYVWLP